MSDNPLSRRHFIVSSAASLALAACGGSSSNPGDPTPPAPPEDPTPPAPPEDPTPTPTPEPEALAAPRGLHVSLTGNAQTSRTLTWFTDGSEAPAAKLEYDVVTPDMSAQDIQDLPLAFSVDASHDPTTGIEAFTHRATAADIDPELPMRYRVGADDYGWSPVYVTQPAPTENWSFIHYGDQGTGPLAAQVTDQVLNTPSDLLLIAGDLSYANGDQPIWDLWFDQQQPILATRPMLAAPGNHEEKDFGGDTFKNRFTHPGKPFTSVITGDNPGSTFYCFDYNRVHFLVTTAGALINDGTLPEELLNIEAALSVAAARRASGEIDFVVVMQHFPIWTDQLGRSPANPALVALEENIIVRYGVDLLLVGHDHVYQRSVPMSFGLPNPLGYVQVMVGTGGASIRLFDEDGPQSWSAKQFVGIGYAKYQVSPGKIAVSFVGAPPRGLSDEQRQFSDGNFSVQDEFEILAKDSLACHDCALPARSRDQLLAVHQRLEKAIPYPLFKRHSPQHQC